MGGEGSMMAANQSLKSNRNMLSKRKEKSFSFVSNSKGKTEYNFPKATKEDIILLRNKLRQEQNIRKVKIVFLTSIVVVIFFLILVFYIIN